MTDEEVAAKEYLASVDLDSDIFLQAKINYPKITLIEIFLAGIKYGERKGWDAAREGEYGSLTVIAGESNYEPEFLYKTFEDWKKEQEK